MSYGRKKADECCRTPRGSYHAPSLLEICCIEPNLLVCFSFTVSGATLPNATLPIPIALTNPLSARILLILSHPLLLQPLGGGWGEGMRYMETSSESSFEFYLEFSM